MMVDMKRTMHEAMEFMRAGDLHAATRAILHRLGGGPGADAAPEVADCEAPHAPGADIIEGSYRVLSTDSPGAGPGSADSPNVARHARGEPGEFHEHRFVCEAGEIRYKLFIPIGLGDAAPPLVVMLHGCTQSPDDFARGTRMNALAQEHGYVIAYPAQSKRRNATRCWNWFRAPDQQRDGQGEAALIAALATHLTKAHGLDARRIYAAGLSAGGAMAAVLAAAYPDVFAAIGVHSGLPAGVAHDLPSAFAAMAKGAAHSRIPGPHSLAHPVPAIVFHGDRDATVDPCNGAAIVLQATITGAPTPADVSKAHATSEHGSVAGGRTYTRTIYRNDAGIVVAEQWIVHGGGHAWFGGDSAGSYTDPSGPDASEEMLRFFSQCARAALN
jgi:poly(hydroxyalkanoate) depolymerase family esterase